MGEIIVSINEWAKDLLRKRSKVVESEKEMLKDHFPVKKDIVSTKRCTKCGKRKNLSKFYWNNARNNYRSACIECTKVYQNNYNNQKKVKV